MVRKDGMFNCSRFCYGDRCKTCYGEDVGDGSKYSEGKLLQTSAVTTYLPYHIKMMVS